MICLCLVVSGRFICTNSGADGSFNLAYQDDKGGLTSTSAGDAGHRIIVQKRGAITGNSVFVPSNGVVELLGVNWSVACTDSGSGTNRITVTGAGTLGEAATVHLTFRWPKEVGRSKSDSSVAISKIVSDVDLSLRFDPKFSSYQEFTENSKKEWYDVALWETDGFAGTSSWTITAEGEKAKKGKKDGVMPVSSEVELDKVREMRVKKAYVGLRRSGMRPVQKVLERLRRLTGVGFPIAYHVGIFVSEGEKGVVLEYGGARPSSKVPSSRFINEDGATFGVVTLEEFGEWFDAVPIRELVIGRDLTIGELLSRAGGHWRAEDYDTLRNNCQDFVASIAKAGHLKAAPGQPLNRWEIPLKIAKVIAQD